MASIEFIEKRISGAEDKLVKLENKLERILKAEASNWENNPYYYNEYDKKYCLREIEETKNSLEKYKNQLTNETEKANSRDVQIIIDFLENWKQRVYDFYKKGLTKYFEEKAKVQELYKAYSEVYFKPAEIRKPAEDAYNNARIALKSKICGYEEKKTFINRWGKEDYTLVKVKNGEWEYLKDYIGENTLEENLAKLEKHLEQEKNRKYDFIIERTNKIVGQITDASGLTIGAKGDLNGIIVGTRGKAHVETIGAGGYNIQVFHFRTLIKEVK